MTKPETTDRPLIDAERPLTSEERALLRQWVSNVEAQSQKSGLSSFVGQHYEDAERAPRPGVLARLGDLLQRLWRPKRQPNIAVYRLGVIDAEGNAKASLIGIIPRFSNAYESRIRTEQRPHANSYINAKTATADAMILAWTANRIDAVCFMSADAARGFPGFQPFPPDDLAQMDHLLTHFPR